MVLHRLVPLGLLLSVLFAVLFVLSADSPPTQGARAAPAAAVAGASTNAIAPQAGLSRRTFLPVILAQATHTPTPSRTPTRTATRTATGTRTATPTRTATALPGDTRYYDIGSPGVQDIWVDPAGGDDGRSGASRSEALRTVSAAWDRIPSNTVLTTGYRIMLVAGVYPEEDVPIYWEARYGTYAAPVILQAADGAGSARLPSLTFYDVRYLYLIGLRVEARGGDVVQCEQCNHLLIRNSQLVGVGNPYDYDSPQEALKVNQSRYVFVEDSELSGAYGNALDFVAVQNGHLQGNRIHDAVDWCAYAKGGSAYLRIEGNEFCNCGTGGFSAGQGTGFEFMVSPWLHYEAYDIKIINNVVHDTDGAGLGVNGAYNVLIAYNTLYRVGSASHVLEFVHGNRACNGNTAACQSNLNAGGWGVTGDGGQWIPNRNVYVYNNVVYNPAPFQSQWTHFAIQGPVTPPSGSHVPSPSKADDNLVVSGNVIWNGPTGHPLGTEESDAGCQPANPTCNTTLLLSRNAINTLQPQLANPAAGDFRPATGGNLFTAVTYAIPGFTWSDAPTWPAVPAGNLSNAVTRDRNGVLRTTTSPPGAYVR